jgi:hypothetical protein
MRHYTQEKKEMMSHDLIGKSGYITTVIGETRTRVRVTIVGVSKNRYRVRLEQDAIVPRRGSQKAGYMLWLPKVVVRLEVSHE